MIYLFAMPVFNNYAAHRNCSYYILLWSGLCGTLRSSRSPVQYAVDSLPNDMGDCDCDDIAGGLRMKLLELGQHLTAVRAENRDLTRSLIVIKSKCERALAGQVAQERKQTMLFLTIRSLRLRLRKARAWGEDLWRSKYPEVAIPDYLSDVSREAPVLSDFTAQLVTTTWDMKDLPSTAPVIPE